jgi:hypothetical protein
MVKRWKRNKKDDMAGYVFVGFLFIGMAVGAIYGRWDIGPFLGLGMGFIASAIVKMKY